MPTEHKEGAFYDIVLGVSTQNLNIDSIESILFCFEQVQSMNDGIEYEVGHGMLIIVRSHLE